MIAISCTPKQPAKLTQIQERKSTVVAIVADTPIKQSDLWNDLIESNNGQIFDEYVLGIIIKTELRRQGLKLLGSDIKAEETLIQNALNTKNQKAVEYALQIRGIGISRLKTLYERSAGLRKLISKDIRVTEESSRQMFEITYGPFADVSIIIVPNRNQATKAKNALKQGLVFHDVAKKFSNDSTANVGGDIGLISLADPAWPTSIRETLSVMTNGGVSDPVLINNQWAILRLNNLVLEKPTVRYQDVKEKMELLATRAQERMLMERLVRTLRKKYRPIIFDETIQKQSSFYSD